MSEEANSQGTDTAQQGEGAPFGVPQPGTADTDGERDPIVEDIIGTVYAVFHAFSNSDTVAFTQLVDNECRFVRVAYGENEAPDVTSFPKEYFVETLKKTKKGVLKEIIEQPFVQMRDALMAHVWCRYHLVVNGSPKYSGVKSIQLRRGVAGWRLVNVCDTVDSD